MSVDMKTSDFAYELPKELIAQDPLSDRSSSRLLHLDRKTGICTHGVFRDILKYLHAGHAGGQRYPGDTGAAVWT